MSRHRLIVGVDYGTTYSGVSFVTTDKANLEDITVIRSWPGKDGEWKTPTRVAYAQDNTRHSLTEDLWGYQVEPGMVACAWTKLLLDKGSRDTKFDDAGLQAYIDEGRMRLPRHRDAKGVATDFMRELYKQMEYQIVKDIGQSTFDSTPMDVWLTVPAVWSDKAKSSTKSAAKNAGFGSRQGDTLSVIPEPEAAAVAVLKSVARPEALTKPKPNETILICDCGGGTVDLTSYTVIQLTPHPEFEEVCVGTGGKCGSTSIDRSLQQLMSKRFGAGWENVNAQRKGPGSHFMNKWEFVKRQFGRPGDERIQELGPLNMKNVDDSEWYDEEEAMVRLTKADVKSVFDPTVNDVLKLVQQQKTAIERTGKRLNRVVLVGGFGDSAYLYKKLEMWCAEKGNIPLQCPEHPQAAIVRGAALRGLVGIAPKTKRCRRHYGCRLMQHFREGIDDPNEAHVDKFSQEVFCKNRMQWLINKGDKVTSKTFVTHSVEFTVRVKDTDKRGQLKLYSCGLDNAPEHCDPLSVESLGTVVVDWTNAALGTLPEKRDKSDKMFGSGSRYHCVPVEVQVLLGSRTGLLQVKAVCNGVPVGEVEIVYE